MLKTDPIDLFHPELRLNPYPLYAELRRRAPVCQLERPRAWAVSRYEDVAFALKRPDLFSSRVMARADPVLLGADPPQHTRPRAIVSGALLARLTAELDRFANAAAQAHVDDLLAKGGGDVVADLAAPLPVRCIAWLLGIPPSGYLDFKRWADAVVAAASGLSENGGNAVDPSISEFEAFFEAEMKQRCRVQGDDLLGALLAGIPGETGLSPHEALSVGKLLLIAGSETATNLIGNAVLALLQHPRELSTMLAAPFRVADLVEETLRFDSPVQFLFRLASVDVTLADTKIPQGSLVILLLGSANRDEHRFHEPDRFDLDRGSAPHLAFGLGPHYCLGAELAKREATAALEALLARAKRILPISPAGEEARVRSIQLRGPASLWVELF